MYSTFSGADEMSIHRQIAEHYNLYEDKGEVLVCERVEYAPYGANSFHITEIFDPIITDRNTGELIKQEIALM